MYALRQAMGLDRTALDVAVHCANETRDEGEPEVSASDLDNAPCIQLAVVADLAEMTGEYDAILRLKNKDGIVKEWIIRPDGFLEEMPSED
jgi:hypothetical protein